jgi:hypothetical protein
MKKRILPIGTLAIAGAIAAGTAFATPTRAHQLTGVPPMPPASSFSAHVTNQWFPLRPGSRYLYTGVKDGKPARDVVTITKQTATILGVPCVAVSDRLYLAGRLEERTTDWYSQDSRGDVWYFGENTAELDRHGRVTTTEGTWRAGRNGARPGIYMPANPHLGQYAEQEYYKGHAEDRFKVIGLFGTVFGHAETTTLLTEETTPLEPGTVDHKMYVRGIGTVLEQTERGPNERNELISVTRGG